MEEGRGRAGSDLARARKRCKVKEAALTSLTTHCNCVSLQILGRQERREWMGLVYAIAPLQGKKYAAWQDPVRPQRQLRSRSNWTKSNVVISRLGKHLWRKQHWTVKSRGQFHDWPFPEMAYVYTECNTYSPRASVSPSVKQRKWTRTRITHSNASKNLGGYANCQSKWTRYWMGSVEPWGKYASFKETVLMKINK